MPDRLPILAVDADVAGAHTLDAAFYRDPAVYAAVRERVFARSWQWLGDAADVGEPGTLSPRVMLPGLLDEPLLLARDAAGTLRCLSNVCTHRGNLLVAAPCRGEQIRCAYHARRFSLDGCLRFMPGFEGVRDFPAPQDDLPRVAMATFGDHVFAALDPVVPFDDVIADVAAGVGWLDLGSLVHDPARNRDFTLRAHWALYVENYLEGLHIPFLHPGLNKALDWSGYRYERYRWANLQLGLAGDGQDAFDDLPTHSPEAGQRVAAYYYWVFPNLMLNFYPWGLSLNLVQPLGPALTRVSFRAYVRDPARLGSGAGAALDTVEMEDEAVVEAVQRGIRSRLYRGGRYSVQHEAGTHQFHRLLCEMLAGS